MKKTKSPLIKILLNSGIYSITTVLQKAVGFILLPLYTIYLTPNDYGITGIVNSLTTVLSILFTLSLNSAIQRYYVKYKEDAEKVASFNGTIVIFILINSILLGGGIIAFHSLLIDPFIDGIEFYPYILIGILTIIVNPIYTIYQSLLQSMQKAKSYSINSLLNFIFMVALNVLFIVIFKFGAIGQLLTYLISGIVFALYSVYHLFKLEVIKFKINWSYLKEALIYSVPLLPHNLSMYISDFISRLFLNNQVSTASVGLYNIASQFITIITIVQSSVNSAYLPWFFESMDQGEIGHEKVIKFADLISKLYFIISLMFVLFIKEGIQIFLPESYLSSWMMIPIMVVAYQIKSIYFFYVNTLFYNTKGTRYIFIGSLVGNIISIILTYTLTSYIGLYTPAIVLLIKWIITTTLVVCISNKVERVKFNLGKMILIVIFLAIASYLGLIFDIMNPQRQITVMSLLYKVSVFLLSSGLIINKDFKEIKKVISDILPIK